MLPVKKVKISKNNQKRSLEEFNILQSLYERIWAKVLHMSIEEGWFLEKIGRSNSNGMILPRHSILEFARIVFL